MKKKLPNIYKGSVKNNSINQKQSVINLKSKEKESVAETTHDIFDEEKNVNRQIKDIFNSPNYVYKADVSIITTSGETLKKTIIGRTNNSLITIDDELIDVSKISQISFLD